MDHHFFQQLNDKTLVLTANRRLSSYLHHHYAKYQGTLGKTVWPAPDILPLNGWITRLWRQLRPDKTLLTPLQEQSIWNSVSQQDWTTLPTIQQAWNHLYGWNIDLEALQFSQNDATQSFYRWAIAFKSLCQQNRWISTAELPATLLQLNSWNLPLPQTIFLCGFDDFPPVIAALFDKICPHCQITTTQPKKNRTSIKRVELADTETEIRQMASWARTQHEQNPTAKITCVVPHLTEIRQQVLRLFLTTFADKPAVLNIGSGQALDQFPLIQAALQALRLSANLLNEDQWESLLQSPYLALSEEDLEVGALADAIRRQHNLNHLTAKEMLPIFTALQARFPQSTWLKRWNLLINLQKSLPAQQKLRQWLLFFSQLLATLQWPGYRSMNSIEHQIYHRWQQALEELLPCDPIFAEINSNTALSLLQAHLKQIIFQAKSKDTPVQVLGILETTGMPFDALWVMGLNSERWPGAAAPNPFLPYSLQVTHNMPHACAERELLFAERTMTRLLSSSTEIILSAPQTEGDRPLTPSPLIESYQVDHRYPQSVNNTTGSQLYLDNIDLAVDLSNQSDLIEQLVDDQGTPVLPTEHLNGGTFILKSQALCPFSAFANIRLDATPLAATTIGLSPQRRGQLLHHALEFLWKQLKSQETLLALSLQEMTQLLTSTLNRLLEDEELVSSRHRTQPFLALEKIRLRKILSHWFELEKQRHPFVVIGTEVEHQITIGELKIPGRIDRVDQLSDGSLLIIDYKSSASSIDDWFSDRPLAPQLPIYCVFAAGVSDYRGAAFAQVQVGNLQFKGLIAEDSPEVLEKGFVKINHCKHPDAPESWKGLLAHWKAHLETLSRAFCQGMATVAPIKTACDYCALQPLCRVKLCPQSVK